MEPLSAAARSILFKQITGFHVLDRSNSPTDWQFQVKEHIFFVNQNGDTPSGEYTLAINVERVDCANLKKIIFSSGNAAKEATEKVMVDNGKTGRVYGDF